MQGRLPDPFHLRSSSVLVEDMRSGIQCTNVLRPHHHAKSHIAVQNHSSSIIGDDSHA
jgi:hypothetical protein